MLRLTPRLTHAYALFAAILLMALSALTFPAAAANIFAPPVLQPANIGGGVGTPYAAVAADFNNDGYPDLAIVKNNNNGSGSLAIYTRNAIGTLTLAHDYGVFNLVNPREVVAADVNGDGKIDLIVTDDGGISILLGTGDPTASFVAANPQRPYLPDLVTAFGSTIVADLNHDGKPDLLTLVSNGPTVYLEVLLGIGGGKFEFAYQFDVGNVEKMSLAKVDGDNEPDLILNDMGTDKLFFMKGFGGGFFLPSTMVVDYKSTVWVLHDLRTIDLDGDGKIDVVMSTHIGADVWLAKGNGDGTFQAPTLIVASGVSKCCNRDMGQMVIADVNGDGRLDIVVDGYVALQQANHTFVINEHIGYSETRMLTAINLNNDGRADIITKGSVPFDTKIAIFKTIAGIAANVSTTGSPQSTVFSTAFANSLTVTVKDASNIALPNVQVSFSVPFGVAVASATGFLAATNAQGKVSYTPTANGVLGCYQITATITGIVKTETFDMCNTGANTLTVTAASNNQNTLISTAFGTALQVKLTDPSNVPKVGVTVTFSGPNSGARATLSSATAVTNASGFASVTATANGTAGSYKVLATAPGATPAAISLGNTAAAGAAALIYVASSTPEHSDVTKPFTSPITIHVQDFFANPVAGATVVFKIVPDAVTGASATFSSLTAVSNITGDAQVNATANGFIGQYAVTASLLNNSLASPRTFLLRNIADLPRFMTLPSGTPQSTLVNTPFAQKLRVKVTNTAGEVTPQVRVYFLSNGGATLAPSSALADATGFAETTATADSSVGSYQVGAIVYDTSSETPITQLFDLTNVAAVPGFVLTVTKSGTGSGSVAGTGISCGADCSETLAQNTVVVLTAAPVAGSTFAGWTGAGCSGTGTCSVTMSAAQTVNAQFDVVVVPTFLLTVTKSGAGTGTVTGTGITCGADCTETLAQNTVVVLTAASTAGSTFAGWTGAGCSGTSTCSVTMIAAQTVNAQFDVIVLPNFLLTVTKSGSGTGNVTGTGITCGADCTETLLQNTVVQLTEAATAGSIFVGWTGAGCSGTGTCSVTMSAAQTVNAQFDALPPTVIAATPVPTLHPALIALLTLLMAGMMLLTTGRRWR